MEPYQVHVAITGRAAEASAGRRTWTLDIAINGAEAVTSSLTDPLDEDGHRAVRWYLNEYTQSFPYSVTEAGSARKLLEEYSENVISQLSLAGLVEAAIKHPKSCDVLIEVSDSALLAAEDTIHQLHWELLGRSRSWEGLSDARIIVRRLIQTGDKPSPSLQPKGSERGQPRTISILLVIARDLTQNAAAYSDISPAIGRSTMTSARKKCLASAEGPQVSIEIVRPGTFSALSEHLGRRRDRFDILHFDAHGAVRKKGARLKFNSPDNDELTEVPVREVARLVGQHRIPCVILNSCESARASAGYEANMARVFCEHGVRDVIAAPFKMSSSAAERFLEVFYEKILVHQWSLGAAASASRQLLEEKPLRNARFSLQREVLDWFNLVHYSSGCGPEAQPDNVKDNTKISSEHNIQTAEHVIAQNLRNNDTRPSPDKDPFQADGPLVGRDFDILRLERIVAKERVLLVHGPAGAGKTALLSHVCQVWEETSFVDRTAKIDLCFVKESSSRTLNQLILTRLGTGVLNSQDTWEQLSQCLSQQRTLLIVDSLETAIKWGGKHRSEKGAGLMEWLKQLVTLALSSDSCWVILVDRRGTIARKFLSGVGVNFEANLNEFRLTGLELPDAMELSYQILKSDGIDTSAWKKPELDQLELVLGALECFPGAMHRVLPLLMLADVSMMNFYDFLLFQMHKVPRESFPRRPDRMTVELDWVVKDGFGGPRSACLLALGCYWGEAPSLDTFSKTIAQSFGQSHESARLGYFEALDRGWMTHEDGWFRVHPLLTIYSRNWSLWGDPDSAPKSMFGSFLRYVSSFVTTSKDDTAQLIQAITIPRSTEAESKTAGRFREAYLDAMEVERTAESVANAVRGKDYKEMSSSFPRKTHNLFCAIHICLSAPESFPIRDWPWMHFIYGCSTIRMVGSVAQMAISARLFEDLLRRALDRIGGLAVPPELQDHILMIGTYLSSTYISDLKGGGHREKGGEIAQLTLDIVKATEERYGPMDAATTVYLRGVAYRRKMLLSIRDEDIPAIREFGALSDQNDDEYLRITAESAAPQAAPNSPRGQIMAKMSDQSIQIAYAQSRKETLLQLNEAIIHQIQNGTPGGELLSPMRDAIQQQSFALEHTFMATNDYGYTGLQNQHRWWPEHLDMEAFVSRSSDPRRRLDEIEDARDSGRTLEAVAEHRELLADALRAGDTAAAVEHSSAIGNMYADDPGLLSLFQNHERSHAVLAASEQALRAFENETGTEEAAQRTVQALENQLAELRRSGAPAAAIRIDEIALGQLRTVMERNGGVLPALPGLHNRHSLFLQEVVQLLSASARDAGFRDQLLEFALEIMQSQSEIDALRQNGECFEAARGLERQLALLDSEMGAPFRALFDAQTIRLDMETVDSYARKDAAIETWGQRMNADDYDEAREQLRLVASCYEQIAALGASTQAAEEAPQTQLDDEWELTERMHLHHLMATALAAMATDDSRAIALYETALALNDAGSFSHVSATELEPQLRNIRYNLALARAEVASGREEFETAAAFYEECIEIKGDRDAEVLARLRDRRDACVYRFHSRRLHAMDLAFDYGEGADAHIAALDQMVTRQEKEKAGGKALAEPERTCQNFTREMLNYAKGNIAFKRMMMAALGGEAGSNWIRSQRELTGGRNPFDTDD